MAYTTNKVTILIQQGDIADVQFVHIRGYQRYTVRLSYNSLWQLKVTGLFVDLLNVSNEGGVRCHIIRDWREGMSTVNHCIHNYMPGQNAEYLMKRETKL